MPEHILFFDIDGTMLSTGGAGQKAMELALVEDFNIDFPFEDVLTAGRTDRGIADEIFQKYQLIDTPAERERFRQALGVFVMVLFLWGFVPWLFALAVLINVLAYFEELLIIRFLAVWTPNVRGLWWVLRSRGDDG